MSAPGLAVFDLGGVIVRICRSWQEGCRAAGIALKSRDGNAAANMAAVLERAINSGARPRHLTTISAATPAAERDARYAGDDRVKAMGAFLLGGPPAV